VAWALLLGHKQILSGNIWAIMLVNKKKLNLLRMLLCIYYNSVVANLSSEKKGYALRFGGKIVFLLWHDCFFTMKLVFLKLYEVGLVILFCTIKLLI